MNLFDFLVIALENDYIQLSIWMIACAITFSIPRNFQQILDIVELALQRK